MQDIFLHDESLRRNFIRSLSIERFATYTRLAHSDELRSIRLYKWNVDLAQALWPTLQAWEVCLRNRLNDFLCWKYSNNAWPYDTVKAVRQLKANDQRRLKEARERQERKRHVRQAPLGAIVADLSPGFWVSLLSGAYDVPFVWRANLGRIFPNEPTMARRAAWKFCNDLLDLRNRIAHHEPILHLPLEQRYADLDRIIAAMCSGTSAYCQSFCSFQEMLARRP